MSWTVVLEAARGDDPGALAAWEELARRYWRPLYIHCRLRGDPSHVAEDHVQGLFESLLCRNGLAGVSKDAGPPVEGATPSLFRNWLRASLENFRVDERRRAHAQKRRPSGGFDPRDIWEIERELEVHLQEPVGRAFDRQWAVSVLGQARRRLRDQYASRGIAEQFDILWHHVVPGTHAGDKPGHARSMGLKPGSFDNALNRFRTEYGRAIRKIVRETTADDCDVDSEIRHLLEVLA